MAKPRLSKIRRFVKNWPGLDTLLLYGLTLDPVEQFFDDFRMKYERRKRVPHANLFQILRLGSDEVRHSRFLAWLLDCEESHLEGPRFLRAFLHAAGFDDWLPTVTDDCMYEVWRERPDRIDLSIHARGKFAIYIENKIDALEGTDQLRRYYRSLKVQSQIGAWNIPEDRRAIVFLTPRGRDPVSFGEKGVPVDVEYASLSHLRLGSAFRTAVNEESGCPELIKLVVRDYVSVVQRLISNRHHGGF